MTDRGFDAPGVSVRPRPEPEVSRDDVTLWTGWIGFAASMAVLVGIIQAVQGLVGIFKDGYYAVPTRDLMVTVDYSVWGWAHLVFGLLAIGLGFGLAKGRMWARVLGVIIAMLSIVANIAFLNASPALAMTIIAFDVLLIWALTVHGHEMKALN
jgi:hypothetical protein